MDSEKNNNLKERLSNIDWNNVKPEHEFRKDLEDIVQIARDITEAEVGVFFLTTDGIFLEAAHWQRGRPPQPPASELPEYRLHWGEKDKKKLDGITAHVVVNRKVGNLNQKGVFNHEAWKGKWDAVFLEGDRNRCKGILAVPIQEVIGSDDLKGYRVHGVLKVENPKVKTAENKFKGEHAESLKQMAITIANKLKFNSNFWCNFVQSRADIKVSYLVELLEKGQSLQHNLSHGLNYVIHLFSKWLGCETAIHVFWLNGNQMECNLLRPWDYASGEGPKKHEPLEGKDKETFIDWLEANVGPQIVQFDKPIDHELWKILFGDSKYQDLVDIIRLKRGRYDLGVLLLINSNLRKYKQSNPDKKKSKEALNQHRNANFRDSY